MNTKTLNKINALVDEKFPRTKDEHGNVLCGAMYYAGIDGVFRAPTWILEGMTPVYAKTAVERLKMEGCDVSEIEKELEAMA
jgi:hypothetical protein